MRKKHTILLLGIVVIVSGWCMASCGSLAQPSEGVVDVWATWGDDSDQLQALLERFSQPSDLPVRVTTRVRSEDLLEALAGAQPPDVVILSSSDLVAAYDAQGLVEPLDPWIEATGIDLGDVYPAPLGQCQSPDDAQRCLPWGCDIDALYWNKDLFAAAGLDPERPPQTMEEMVDYAGQLTLRDEQGELGQVGFLPDFPRSHAELYARMLGGQFYNNGGAELAASQPGLDALNWQRQFYAGYDSEELEALVSSFTPYMTSRHALYAGRRLSCQQCHRSSPIQNKKTPDTGFRQGRMAMMIDGQWQAGRKGLSHGEPPVNYGVAAFPPPSAHPERAGTTVVRGPVVFIAAGAVDKEAAANLLAWMMSPEIVAEAAEANALLPTSRTAARDPRFQSVPDLRVFLDLMAQANAKPAVTTAMTQELSEALDRIEEEVLHQGGDPVLLLDQLQAGLESQKKEALSFQARP